MFNFIQDLICVVIDLQSKFLGKKSKKYCKSSCTNRTATRVYTQGASLELNTKTQKGREKLENNLRLILKKYDNDPEKLLGFVKRSGTKVYNIPCAKRILKAVECEEGFISASSGIKGLYINLITSIFSGERKKLTQNSEAVFIFDKTLPDKHIIIQQFHKWYAMKLNLPGFDENSQNNFQKFLEPENDGKIKDLTIDEILGLKDAIARDVEAITFVVELARSTSGAKNALKKISTGGASV